MCGLRRDFIRQLQMQGSLSGLNETKIVDGAVGIDDGIPQDIRRDQDA